MQSFFVSPSIKILYVIIFFFGFYSSAQVIEQDTLQAWEYYKKGDSLSKNWDFKNSNIEFKKAIPFYEKAEKWSQVARCYNKMSTNYWRLLDNKKCLANANRALKTSVLKLGKDNKEEASAYENIGIYYLRKENLDSALFNFEKGLVIREKIFPENHLAIAKSHVNIGVCHNHYGFYDKAVEHYEIALSARLNSLGPDHPAVGDIYYNLAIINRRLLEFNKAIDYAKKDIAIQVKRFGNEHIIIGQSYRNLANIYTEKGDFQEAFIYFEKSLKILQQKGNQRDIAFTYTSIATAYDLMGDYPEALKNYSLGLNALNKEDAKDNRLNPNTYMNLGIVNMNLKEYETALKYLNKSLISLKEIYGKNHYKIANVNSYIGDLYNLQGNYEASNMYYDKAISILNIPIYNFNKQEKFSDPIAQIEALEKKGKNLMSAFLSHKKIDYLNQSILIYQNAISLIDNHHNEIHYNEDKIEFSRKIEKVYKGLIQAKWELFKIKKSDTIFTSLFYYSEKNKAAALNQSLSASRGFNDLPSDLSELENTLKIRKTFYQSEITNELEKKERDSSRLTSFEDRLFSVNRSYDSLIEVIEKQYPKYHDLKYNTSVISVEEVQQKLDAHSTLLEYFTADSTTYAFVINKDHYEVKELATPGLLDKVTAMRAALENKKLDSYKDLSHELYQTLVAPVKEQLKGTNLIVVPDGPLWHLNFDLLLSENTDTNNPQELPYLLKAYAISYANSANLLFNRPDYNTKKTLNEALAFSYADTTATATGDVLRLGAFRDTGEDLPGTRKEIKAISELINGKYYYGKEAVEANFKKDADKYGIVHLALHGEVDNEQPQNSRLYFTKTNDSIEDNLLYSHELFALNIPAELTVLSACHTGTGKIAKGEGIMSLGNAFQYAGTKSLLLSSWEVADDTAPELMKYFYSNLKKGMNKAEALQQAKLSYLNTADPSRINPFYWGNFYIVGDSKAIDLKSTSYWYWTIAGIALLSMGLFFFNKRKQKQLRKMSA